MGLDRVLKVHHDEWRAKGAPPPEIAAALPGWKLFADQARVNELRNWRKGLTVVIDGIDLSTALDDVLHNPERGLFRMLDYKTKAKLTDEADTVKYYAVQAAAYDLALNENGMPTDGVGVFTYYAPVNVPPDGPVIVPDDPLSRDAYTITGMRWSCQVIPIKAEPALARDLTVKASACLGGPMPLANEECALCAYIGARRERIQEIEAAAKTAADKAGAPA
jgi:hypothetical protein